ncbi:hypothetical protein GCWU000324_03191 [Kingella oralis ATCC 51147]|uniref:Uncharacterized protein n=1 Tax=Kingella oralis ATCC 51147 TaxID=629741 RepID=C4GNA2_9NEIS|nr:hypothetical protein GCWU000324_03191 [Kingella oralis ATCC 51147]
MLGLPENYSFKYFQVAFAASNAYFQVYLKPTLPRQPWRLVLPKLCW